jgi:predicted phosphate transport protein (TIGR00153 family)
MAKNRFYLLLAEAGENAQKAAQLVTERLSEFPDTSIPQTEVKELERRGDQLTAEIFDLLNNRYECPLDREDIYVLARAIDDVVDYIEHASDLLDLYKIEAATDQALAQAEVLVRATTSLSSALSDLEHLEGVKDQLVAIKSAEDEGDRIVRDAIAALFEDDDIDPRMIIRWKDIFEALEDALDACDSAGHVIGNVLVKSLG